MLSSINKIVINLPERTDRLEQFTKEFKYIFDDTYTIQPGIRKDPSWHGIAEAHMNCIKTAKENKWPYVLIMEDDLYIPAKEKARKYIDEAFNKLPEDWDILLGGVYHVKTAVKANNYWNRIGEFCALHFYIVNERCYDQLLTWDKTNHYDRWIGRLGLKCYVPTRFFAIQYDGYSDNVAKVTDYNNIYLKHFEILK